MGVEGAVDRGHWGYNRTKDRKTRTLAPGARPKVLLRKNGKLALFIVCLACGCASWRARDVGRVDARGGDRACSEH